MFQSTLPHGERQDMTFGMYAYSGFNPRSRMGSDIYVENTNKMVECFNPRSRMGSDAVDVTSCVITVVSIHAPAWGATACYYVLDVFVKFQSTLPHGERRYSAIVASRR